MEKGEEFYPEAEKMMLKALAIVQKQSNIQLKGPEARILSNTLHTKMKNKPWLSYRKKISDRTLHQLHALG